MKVFFYALFFHLTLNAYVFWRGWQVLRSYNTGRTVFAGVFITEFILYLAGLIFQHQLPDSFVCGIALLGTTWMLFALYMTLFLLVIDLIFWMDKRKPYLRASLRKSSFRALLFALSLICVITIMMQGNYRFFHPSVVEKRIVVHKNGNGIDSLTIVVAGDLHLGFILDKSHAQRFVKLINDQKPDLILFVGDIVDAGIAPLLHQRMEDNLRQLHAPLGIYTCTGNHEYRYEAEEKIKWLHDRAGINVLRDSAVLIGQSFYILGREDRSAPLRKPLQTVMDAQDIHPEKPLIVLDHNPKDLHENAHYGADIALYGHTHEGQFFPANWVTRLLFEVAHGYKRIQNTHTFVTSGLGIAGTQYRIGTQSEIVVIHLVFDDRKP